MADGDKSLQLDRRQIKKKRKFERKSIVRVTTATAKVLRRGSSARFYALGKLQQVVSQKRRKNPQIQSRRWVQQTQSISFFLF
jgi:hypothetical protein